MLRVSGNHRHHMDTQACFNLDILCSTIYCGLYTMYTRENNRLPVRGSELKEKGFSSEPVSFSTVGSPVHSTVRLLMTFQHLGQLIDSDQCKFQSNKASVTQADTIQMHNAPGLCAVAATGGRQSRNIFPSLLRLLNWF